MICAASTGVLLAMLGGFYACYKVNALGWFFPQWWFWTALGVHISSAIVAGIILDKKRKEGHEEEVDNS